MIRYFSARVKGVTSARDRGPILKFARDSLEHSRRSNGRVERNGKLVFSSSFDMAFERHLVYDLHAVLPSRSFHLQSN